MKKTFKKILAVMLAVVLLFGAAPLCKTDGILTTKASALETVEGSYDRLEAFVKANGKKNADGNLQFERHVVSDETDCVIVFINYKNAGKIRFKYIYENKKNKSETTMYFDVAKNDTASSYKTFFSRDGYEAYANINAGTYKTGTAMSYTYSYSGNLTTKAKKALNELFDALIGLAVTDIDLYLKTIVEFGIGNFGFAKISAPMPVPALSFFDKIAEFFKIMFNAIKALFTIV